MRILSLFRAVLVLVIAVAFAAFGALGWPGLHWDASLFATPVLNVAQGDGWIFGGYPLRLTTYPDQEYAHHGILHVIVFGVLLRTSSWETFLLASGVVSAASFLAWMWVSSRISHPATRWTWITSLGIGITAGMIATGLQGRPEQLGPLLLSLPLLLRTLVPDPRVFRAALFLQLGIMPLLSPASGLLYGMGLVYWLALQHEKSSLRAFLLQGIVANGTALATAWLVISLFCPFSLPEWLRSTAGGIPGSLDFSHHLFDFRLSRLLGVSFYAPGWNLLVLCSGLFFVFILFRRRCWIGLAFFLSVALYTYPKLTDYGYAAFFPLVLYYLYQQAGRHTLRLGLPRPRIVVGLALLAITGLYGLGFLRNAALCTLMVTKGIDLAESRAHLDELGALDYGDHHATAFQGPSRPSFIVFGDGGKNYIVAQHGKNLAWRFPHVVAYQETLEQTIDFYIHPQTRPGPPPADLLVGLERLELVHSGWTDDRPQLLGVPLAKVMPGYQFALYRRAETVPVSTRDAMFQPSD